MTYSKPQLFFLAALRLFIGWHFLFEGLVKLLNPSWTAKGYLMSAHGPFAPLFQWMAGGSFLNFADTATAVALSTVGLTLILGIWEKAGAFIGMGMLAFFYLAHPALPVAESTAPTEGNYFIVDKNLVEMAALGVLAFFPTGHLIGLRVLLNRRAPALAQNKANG